MKKFLKYGGICLLILLAILFWFALGPSRQLTISAETTRFVEPLDDEGRVDCVAALRELQREGVTPENNAAIPLLLATWPSGMSPDDAALVCQELGIDPPTEAGMTRVINDDACGLMEAILSDQGDAKYGEDNYIIDGVENAIEQAVRRPWRREQFPPLAEALDRQAAPLANLRQLAGRERFYFPPPDYLRPTEEPLMLLNSPADFTVVSQGLLTRAMLSLGEGDPRAAWDDVRLVLELSRLEPKAPTLQDKIVAGKIREWCVDPLLQIVSSGKCDEALLAKIGEYLAELPSLGGMDKAIDQAERLSMLQHGFRGACGELGDHPFPWKDKTILPLVRLPFDEIQMMRTANQAFDDHRKFTEIKNYRERDAAYGNGYDQLISILHPNGFSRLAASYLNQNLRGQILGEILAASMLASTGATNIVQTRTNVEIQLVRIAVALEQFRQTKNAYPETLTSLGNAIEPEMLVDVYADAPLHYERRGDGYLLYSLYFNYKDDEGTSISGEIVHGEWQETAVNDLWDWDLVVRVPMPAMVSPTISQLEIEPLPDEESEEMEGAPENRLSSESPPLSEE